MMYNNIMKNKNSNVSTKNSRVLKARGSNASSKNSTVLKEVASHSWCFSLIQCNEGPM